MTRFALKSAVALSTVAVHLIAGGAVADAVDSSSGQAGPLVIEDIVCVGNQSTDCGFIRNQIYLSPGDKLDEEEVQTAKIRLGLLPNFSASDITLKKGTERGRVILEIDVTERTPIASEMTTGTAWTYTRLTQRFAGKIAYQNLFGRGKSLEASFDSKLPIANSHQRVFQGRIQYTDPQLFDSKKYFFVAGATALDETAQYTQEIDHTTRTSVDFAIGRRFGDFSYVSLGVLKRLSSTYAVDVTGDLPSYYDEPYKNGVFINYGWNSEDDPIFPTQGSKFNLGFGWQYDHVQNEGSASNVSLMADIFYRTSWRGSNGGVWSFNVGGSPQNINQPNFSDELLFSWGYAKPILPSSISSDMTRARWYTQVGTNGFGWSTYSGFLFAPGVKAGIRMESKTLGVIDLYALAATQLGAGGR
jgi:outer membrane protein assembly factor BamA